MAFARTHWPHLVIVDDFAICPTGSTILSASRSTKSLEYVFKDGARYGCTASITRQAGTSTGDHFACVDINGGRHPSKILNHLLVTVADQPPIHLSVIQRMYSDDDLPSVPWDL